GSSTTFTATVSNTGCADFTVDSAIATDPAVFFVDAKKIPLKLMPGKSVTVAVTFHPVLEGDYLESLNISTSIGSRYISLIGYGREHPQNDIVTTVPAQQLSFYPNPADNILTISYMGNLPKKILMRDI